MKHAFQSEFSSYRVKIILLLLFSLTLFSLASYLLARFLVNPALLRLEQTLAAKEINNFYKLLDNEITALDTITWDWAAWDDTYNFVRHPNDEYLKSNLTDSTFTNGKINLIAIIRSNGDIVFHKVLNLTTLKEIPLRLLTQQGLKENRFLIRFKGPEDYHRGFIATEHGPLLIASRPIVTSENKGPVRGAILFGRFFFPDIALRMSEYENLTVKALPVERLDAGQREILGNLAPGKFIYRYQPDLLTVYSCRRDLRDRPLLLFEFTIKRHLIQQVRLTLKYVIQFDIIVGVILIGILLIAINRITLSIQRLLTNVHSFTYANDRAAEKEKDPHDQSFATAIQMLSTDFHERHRQQEEFLNQRTADLQEANRLLSREIRKRMETEQKLLESQSQLEEKIARRTRDLTLLTEDLQREIQDRKEYEIILKKQQKQLRQLSTELHSVAEKERRQIATDLHDRIGQSLSALKIFLDTLSVSRLDDNQRKNVEKMTSILQQTIEDTRTMTFEISPPVLYELGLIPALEWYLDKMLEQHPGLIIDLRCGKFPHNLIPTAIQSLVFQIVRELLTNIVKHSGADYAVVKISFADGTLKLKVQDNGLGFDPDAGQAEGKDFRGFGLFNIRERLTSLNGNIEISAQPGKGASVTITVPIPM